MFGIINGLVVINMILIMLKQRVKLDVILNLIWDIRERIQMGTLIAASSSREGAVRRGGLSFGRFTCVLFMLTLFDHLQIRVHIPASTASIRPRSARRLT